MDYIAQQTALTLRIKTKAHACMKHGRNCLSQILFHLLFLLNVILERFNAKQDFLQFVIRHFIRSTTKPTRKCVCKPLCPQSYACSQRYYRHHQKFMEFVQKLIRSSTSCAKYHDPTSSGSPDIF